MCYYIQRASKHLEKQDTDAQQQRSESTRVLPRLPNMELPEFSGGIRDWEAFYSVFKSRVHDNKSISNDDKIDYLIGRLKGPALSVCSTVAATRNDEPETVESEKGPDTSKNVSEEGPSNSVNFCGAISDAQENTKRTVVLLPTAVVDVLNGSNSEKKRELHHMLKKSKSWKTAAAAM
nr:unnamed protein product [Callosobruchus analis]